MDGGVQLTHRHGATLRRIHLDPDMLPAIGQAPWVGSLFFAALLLCQKGSSDGRLYLVSCYSGAVAISSRA